MKTHLLFCHKAKPSSLASAKIFKLSFLVALLILFFGISKSNAAVQYFYPASSPANWNSNSWNTSCVSGSTAWTNGNDANICSGRTCNVAANGNTAGTITVAGTLNIPAGYTLTCTNLAMSSGGILNITGGSLVVTGNVSGTAGTIAAATAAGTLRIGGAFSFTGTFTPGTYLTVEFNGSGSQTIPAKNYYGLMSSGTGARTLASTGTIGVSGVFTPGTNSYTVTGSTVSFNGSGAQSIPVFPYNNLSTATGGTKTIGGTVTVTAVLNVGSGSILDVSTNSLTLSGTSGHTVTGTLQEASGGTITVSGSGNITNNGTMTINGLINFSYAGSQTLPDMTVGATGELRLSTSGAKSFTSITTINGKVSRQGTTTIGGSTSLTYNTGSTLEFKGSNAQTVSTYEWPSSGPTDVIIDNSNGVTLNLSSVDRTIKGTLYLTNGVFNVSLSSTYDLIFHTGNTPIVKGAGTMTLGANTGLTFGIVSYTGGNAFTIPDNVFTSSPVFANLTVYRSNSLTLNNQQMTVTGTFTLTQGLVILGSADLQVAALSVSSPSASKMVITSAASGYFKHSFGTSSNQTFVYPIGENIGTNEYSGFSFTMNSNSTARVLGFKVVDGVHPDMGSPANYISRYWSCSLDITTGTYTYTINSSGVGMPFNGSTGDIVGASNKIANMYWNGSAWTVSTGTVSSTYLLFSSVNQAGSPLNNVDYTGRQTATDEACGAPALTVNGPVCSSYLTDSIRGATQSNSYCTGSGTTSDVWFKFTATFKQHVITVDPLPGSLLRPVFEVYSGSCGSVTALSSVSNNRVNCIAASAVGATAQDVINGLTPTTTYYVRVYHYSGGYPANSGFTICVTTPAPPANDDCSGAVDLTTADWSSNTTCILTPGTTVNATELISGGSVGNDDDEVWYKFTPTGTSARIEVTGNGGFNPYIELRGAFGGGCNGQSIKYRNWTAADGSEMLNVTNLYPGWTYYVRVFSYSKGMGKWGDFDICAYDGYTPSGNDNICDAIDVPFLNTPVVGNDNEFYGFEMRDPLGGCPACSDGAGFNWTNGHDAQNTEWFSFTPVNSSSYNVAVSMNPSVTFEAYIREYYDTLCNTVTAGFYKSEPNSLGPTVGSGNMPATCFNGAVTYYIGINGYQYSHGIPTVTVTNTSSLTVPLASSANNITCTGFTANWNSVASIDGYYIDVSTATDFSSYIPGYFSDTLGLVTTCNVTGLAPGVTYYYRIRDFKGACNTSNNSNAVSVTTLAIPGAPVVSAATNTGCTSFIANWSAVSNAGQYYLDVSTTPDFSSFVPGYNQLPVAGVSDNFDDLDYSSNPVWTVQSGAFEPSASWLEGDDVFMTDRISTPSSQAYGVWEYKFCMQVATTGEYARYFLVCDKADPGNSASGYYVWVDGGLTGNRLQLRRIDNGTAYTLIAADWTPGTSTHSVKVTRNSSNQFELFFDGSSKGTNTDNTYTTSSYIGIWNTGYQSNDNPRFDDISSNPSAYTVTGLNPGTTYYYQVWSSNTCGNTVSADSVEVTTISTQVPPSFIAGSATHCAGDADTYIATAGGTPVVYSIVSGGATIDPNTGYTDNMTGDFVVRAKATGSCGSDSTDLAVTVNPVPDVFNVTGGGSYCSESAAVSVGLDGSVSGVDYQLLYQSAPLWTALPGTGSVLDFGLQTQAGAYTVLAADAVTGCQSGMAGSALISVYNCPASCVSVAINTTGASADTSAILDISDTISGVLFPRLTDAQRDVLNFPDYGLIIYNTSAGKVNYFNNGVWYEVSSSSVYGVTSGTSVTYGTAVNSAGAKPAASAMLDVSSIIKGVLIPRTLPGAVYGAAKGSMIFNIHTNTINYFDGAIWNALTGTSVSSTFGTGSQTADGCSVNITNANPAPSAILDVSAQNKALLIPRLTDTERNNISPATGLMIYNTDTDELQYYGGSGWYRLQ